MSAREQETERPIVIGYDGSDEAQAAIEAAARLLAPPSALIAHVYSTPPAGATDPTMASAAAGAGVSAAALAAEPPDELLEMAERRARECAEDGAERARRLGLDARPLAVLVRGSDAGTLLELAREWRASALVVGTRGRGRVKAALLGSVAAEAANAGELPVLVVPVPDPD